MTLKIYSQLPCRYINYYFIVIMHDSIVTIMFYECNQNNLNLPFTFHFADRMLSQLPILQAAQVTFTEPDSTVNCLLGIIATLRSMRGNPKLEDLRTERNVRLVIHNKLCVTYHSLLFLTLSSVQDSFRTTPFTGKCPCA